MEKHRGHSCIHDLLQMQLFCWKLLINPRRNKPLLDNLIFYAFIAGKWEISFTTNEKSNSAAEIAFLVKYPLYAANKFTMTLMSTKLYIFIWNIYVN